MGSYHRVDEVTIENGVLSMLVDGKSIAVTLCELSRRLGEASEAEIRAFEVSPSGYGIHWPLIDEDISIDGLLGVVHAPKQWEKIA